ncbi:peptidoglycan DD-metalloendopeptidase family protein [Falsirhodobacter halotolerans]|uniref:peptidoglycan DD-metalloendopeptidase family protein n=1 Tax=Falsirhodobacter halotolerans TaxID=1146892 RepID=UPI001FD09AC9|nr:peptidoglycan DD-metalloendopeptidase family protein [Falsirhodobacter halotolerans]MCJ8140176.1 peptidoglycan DD-metalloendopeptidase family protein [Falsirhodobacter halotolerans]
MKRSRPLLALSGLALMAACAAPQDWDLRPGLNTGGAAQGATQARPQPDARGVISYPNYQVVIAAPGETVGAIAARIGASADQIAQYNAIAPNAPLRGGEVIALPPGATAEMASPMVGGPVATGIQTSGIETTTLAPTPGSAPAPTATSGAQPAQHRVARGETAYSIARTYNVSPKALAEWNGLDDSLSLREGQMLMIPVASNTPPTQTASAAPAPVPAATPPAPAPAPAANSTQFAMPASGSIIRPYAKGRNEGIDIGAAAGSNVVAAADGTVAAITRDTDQVPILVIRHPGDLLTVYAGIDNVKVERGASVSRGQSIATVRQASPAFLHFEVRKGFESVDPAPYLQ